MPPPYAPSFPAMSMPPAQVPQHGQLAPPPAYGSTAGMPPPGIFEPNYMQQLNTWHTGLVSNLPSAGSALHAVGKCSPCAWVWKAKGCKGGSECTFCHLCPQDELKKRKRAKLAAIRTGVLEPTTQRGAGPAPPEERSHPNLVLSNVLF
eukprot:TRINITY_DN977_c0_g2_i2.p1 TRINITY_DN977_c0_g2~~TRINITY_DN977_c0_g2_i2.p1  ORF type:complete len:149 (-),score=26.12 TRINITY_DN977_c0_g2_i2:360-806(-)